MMSASHVKVIGTITMPVPGAAVLEIPEPSSSVMPSRKRPATLFAQAHWAGLLPLSLCEAHAGAGYLSGKTMIMLQEYLLDNIDYVKCCPPLGPLSGSDVPYSCHHL